MIERAQRRSVLIVDDDRLVRRLARAALSQAGYEVREAVDGESGLAAICANAPDLVLLDVQMPGINGFDVCRSIRRTPMGLDLPVLMMTADDDVESIHSAFSAGATDFIRKPLPLALLGYRVKYLLRSSDATQSLRRSERRLDDAQRAARLGYWDWVAAEDRLMLSPMSRTLFADAGERLGSVSELLALVDPLDRERLQRGWQRVALGGAPLSAEFRLVDPRPEPVWIHARGRLAETGTIDERVVTGTFQDISDIKKREAQTRYLAYFDSLTGLPNRVSLEAQLEKRLARARRHRASLAVLVLDLDNFKQVNETLGRAMGNRLLAEIASRLSRCVRLEDDVASMGDADTESSLARLGGDEFALLIGDVASSEDADHVAQRVLECVRRPVLLDGREVVVTASIGLATFPADAEHSNDLIARADTAMYAAKAAGGDRAACFSAPLLSAARSQFSHEMALRRAIERDQLALHYQPKLEIATGRIVGLEALIRWNHPDLGPVSPANFIPIAERTGMIVTISEWVLRTSLAQIRDWRLAGHGDHRVAVNLSAKHFTDRGLVPQIAGLLTEYSVAPDLLEIEITEGAIMKDLPLALNTTRALRELGCLVAIDDFGTGYSSLAYVRQLSVDHLKIDRAFITNLARDAEDGAIVQSIVDMSNALGIRVIAEGVETHEQLLQLIRRGCHEVQGFLIGRPMAPEHVPQQIAASTELERIQLLHLPVTVAGADSHWSATLTEIL